MTVKIIFNISSCSMHKLSIPSIWPRIHFDHSKIDLFCLHCFNVKWQRSCSMLSIWIWVYVKLWHFSLSLSLFLLPVQNNNWNCCSVLFQSCLSTGIFFVIQMCHCIEYNAGTTVADGSTSVIKVVEAHHITSSFSSSFSFSLFRTTNSRKEMNYIRGMILFFFSAIYSKKMKEREFSRARVLWVKETKSQWNFFFDFRYSHANYFVYFSTMHRRPTISIIFTTLFLVVGVFFIPVGAAAKKRTYCKKSSTFKWWKDFLFFFI